MLILAFTRLCLILTVHSASGENTKWVKLVELKHSAATGPVLSALARGWWRRRGRGGKNIILLCSRNQELAAPKNLITVRKAERKQVAPIFRGPFVFHQLHLQPEKLSTPVLLSCRTSRANRWEWKLS